MNKNKITLKFAAAIAFVMINLPAYAELALPSGVDRRPNLSLDPFKRSSDAIRKPTSSAPARTPVIMERGGNGSATISTPQNAQKTETTSEKSNKETQKKGAFSYNFTAKLDTFSLTDGGVQPSPDEKISVKKNGVVGVIDLIAEFDTEKADLWDGGLFYLYNALTFGEGPTVGDIQGISNIDAGGNTMRIVELWYQHTFSYSHSSMLFGLRDYKKEFYVAKYANLFLNTSFGFGKLIREYGHPSSYPVTTLGMRLKSNITENSYLQFAMYDGNIKKGKKNSEFDSLISVNLSKKDGVFLTGEGGIFKNKPGSSDGYYKVAAGLWYLRAKQKGFTTDPTDDTAPRISENNPQSATIGGYLLAEMSVGKKFGVFFKHGRVQSKILQYDQFYAAGINYSGSALGRVNDIIGIGFVRTVQSSTYLAQFPQGSYYTAETTYEITYSAPITKWLTVQPDFQYVQYPGMDPDIVKAFLIGVRVKAVF